ncbi:unnamed protein product [Gemmata massiliana]|uniref:Uncharacterized protein n=1 Tax=Gemmata massiliana TaxID=1210884 RepID=A0A6P2D6L7_9BACT|nr:unnamed protein product [Gemmata massiliana]
MRGLADTRLAIERVLIDQMATQNGCFTLSTATSNGRITKLFVLRAEERPTLPPRLVAKRVHSVRMQSSKNLQFLCSGIAANEDTHSIVATKN